MMPSKETVALRETCAVKQTKVRRPKREGKCTNVSDHGRPVGLVFFLVIFPPIPEEGERVLPRPYRGLMGTCSQLGYIFRDFCLTQGIDFIIFYLETAIATAVYHKNMTKNMD